MNRMVSCAISMAIALASARADGTEIKVISAGAVRGLIAEMIADYGRATGDRFDFKIGTTGQLRTIIASGQPADLIIASATLMAELEASGKMISGTGVELGARRHRDCGPRWRAGGGCGKRAWFQTGADRGAFGGLQRSASGGSIRRVFRRRALAALTAPSMAERWKAAGFEPPR
jgi:hypothetical protein